jgi:phosphoglycolate phosphatase-like HAD superfamily hydrolase
MNISLPKQLILDLDGTLLDIRKKYYAVYKESFPAPLLSESEFWRLKRAKKLPPSTPEAFHILESERYLAYDSLFPFSVNILQSLIKKGHILHLVSARRNAGTGYTQVKHLGIIDYFNSVDIGHDGKSVVDTKMTFIKKWLPVGTPFALIGDTEDDINSAKALGGIAIAVKSGIRNKRYLLRFSPDIIINSVNDLLDFTVKHQ